MSLRVSLLCAACLGSSVLAGQGATYIVTSTSDSGPGTLRQAILDANANPGLDTITFALTGGGALNITPGSPLPAITNAVIVDGTTQTGYSDHPIIALRGNNAGDGANGLLLQSGGCTVRGLAIYNFTRDGIRIEGPGTNIIQGNHLGTDINGTSKQGNGEGGIMVNGSPGNLIGGTNANDRNVISGGNLVGIYLFETPSQGNRVIGNYVGTDASGTADLGNQENGVVIINAPGNTVGGTSPAERNVISGNDLSGVYIYSVAPGAMNNVVSGNFIGTTAGGTTALGNKADGVTVYGAASNLIGGTNSGAGNLISGNLQRGVHLISFGANGNRVQGNLIGTDVTGRFALANRTNGVAISGVASNLIGGTVAGARNVISGNGQSGIFITVTGAVSNRVEGNYIGVDITGTNALGNAFNGVAVDAGRGNVIGGAAPGAGNVISGNQNNGVFISGTGATNLVQGNLVGTDASGRLKIPNAVAGVRIDTARNTVGGVTEAARNVISGNTQNGLFLVSSAAFGNFVLGNYIGLDVTGTNALGNTGAGIGLTNAPGNFIGSVAVGARNVISGNGDSGIYLDGAGASGNLIQGNYVGTEITGTAARQNFVGGIYLYGAPSNSIGGAVAGAGNLISGNRRIAISIGDPGADGNVIAGNFIGVAADGITALGNQWHGVEILNSASGNTVGGTAAGAGNRLAFAQTSAYDGVRIRDGCNRNAVLRNSMFANGGTAENGLGIDLGVDGVLANDSCDDDSGANQSQNYPQLTVAYGGSQTGVKGTLNGTANTTFRLQFFANDAAEPLGYGEGRTYLGEAFVTTGPACTASFTVDFGVAANPGQVITATATDPLHNTSEISPGAVAAPVPALAAASLSAGQIDLSWPVAAAGFVLKQTDTLTPPVVWTTVTNTISTNGGFNVVTPSLQEGSKFYRLALE